jgi:hypothetical protein
VVRYSLLLAVLATFAGCGDSSPAPRPASTPTQAPAARAAAPTVVFFQRQGAGGATLDAITVRADGSVTLQKRYGGAGGRFKELALRRGELARVRRDLARLPSGGTLTSDRPAPGGAQYLLRIGDRALTGREGGLSARAKPAVRRLDGYIDGIGVRQVETTTATHRP